MAGTRTSISKFFLLLSTCWSLSALAADREASLTQALEEAGEAPAVEGKEAWRFLPAELRHLLAEPLTPSSPPLEAILDFHRQLGDLGIRLILMPVPPKAAVHAAQLGIPAYEENPDAATLASLRQAGIEIIDLWPAFASSRKPLYCQRDTHWNALGIEIAAQSLAAALQGITGSKAALSSRSETLTINGDLGGDPESITLRFVSPSGSKERLQPSRESPILLFGDSHVLVFHEGGDMHAVSAGLPEQTALALGMPVDVLAVRGSGATAARINLARRARQDPEWLGAKKAIVWCFGAREFTQAQDWRQVPLLPE